MPSQVKFLINIQQFKPGTANLSLLPLVESRAFAAFHRNFRDTKSGREWGETRVKEGGRDRREPPPPASKTDAGGKLPPLAGGRRGRDVYQNPRGDEYRRTLVSYLKGKM